MTKFDVHTKQSAPEQSVKLLEQAESAFGFVPNLLGVMAESPALLEGYLQLGQIFDKSSFSPEERQVAILAISRFNECHYCVAAHSVIASMQEVPGDVVAAIRDDKPVADERLEALRSFTTAVVSKRGWVDARDVKSFLSAGFERSQMLEVILAVSFKTLSNYVNHVAATPLDDAFAAQEWLPGKKQAS